jgi:hypothetical protein
MITTCFARAAQRWTSRICVHVLFTLQEVTPISKTRNQLTRNDVAVWQERDREPCAVAPGRSAPYDRCLIMRLRPTHLPSCRKERLWPPWR